MTTAFDPNSISPEEALRLLWLMKLNEDFPFFADQVLQIQTMEGERKKLTFNKPQQILHEIVEKHIAPKRLVRIIALKARRMGFSTYFSARFYWKTSRKHNRYTAQITHEPEATDTLFKMVKRFYNFSPPDTRPEIKQNNAKLLEFNTKDGQGLDSAFRVSTADKPDFGSGQLVHYLHLSEVSKWNSGTASSLLTSVLQCVPKEQDTEVVFESTAKGVGGEFHDRFWGARYRIIVDRLDENGKPVIVETINESAETENVYTAVFLPWFVFPAYRRPVPDGFELTVDEAKMKARHNLDDEQIMWYRVTLANECNGDRSIMKQEYPSTPIESFISTGRPVFDNEKLYLLLHNATKPRMRYECIPSTLQWRADPDHGRLLVWQEPLAGHQYIIGADVAEGLAKGDASVADVIDWATGEQVAHWHGKIPPDEFAYLLIALARRYNTALVAPERNNNGLTTVTCLFNAKYPRLYVEMVPDPPGKPRKRYGWVTDGNGRGSGTRALIINNLIAELNSGKHGINCAGTYEEMLAFKYDDTGRAEAEGSRHDDRVMSIAIAKYVRVITPMPAVFGEDEGIEALASKAVRGKVVDRRAWT